LENEKPIREIVRILGEISQKLERILESQTVMIRYLEKSQPVQTKRPMPIDVDTLLKLPDHLRISVQALMGLKSATAEEIAAQTHRTRAAESDYLNQLLKMGYLKKERRGRTVFFSVE
jgi:hypothetical protein